MDSKDEIGKIISEARKKKKITQQDLAGKLFVSDKAISNWETNKNLPDKELIPKIEKILNIEISNKIDNKRKKAFKIVFKTLLSILLVIFIILSIYFLNNYNKIKIYNIDVYSSRYHFVNGNLIIDGNKLILKMGKLLNYDIPYQPSYNVELYYMNENKKNIIQEKKNYDYFDINLNTSKEIKDNLNNLYVNISYTNYDGKVVDEELKINVEKIIGNDNFFYKTSEIKDVDADEITILTNNNYKEREMNLYEKWDSQNYYLYDTNKKAMYYQGTSDDIQYYAIKKEYGSIYYIVLKNNTIVEVNLQNYNNGHLYEDILKNKMKEMDKIYSIR